MVEQLTPSCPRGTTCRFRSFCFALAGCTLFGLTNVALAAPGWSASCNTVAQQLKSVDITSVQRSIDRVDLMTGDADVLDAHNARLSDPATPFLFLTPRVVHILEDIFDDIGDPRTAAGNGAPLTVAAGAAGDDASTRLQDSAESSVDASDLDELDYAIQHGAMREAMYNVESLPRFQRPMYRTDI